MSYAPLSTSSRALGWSDEELWGERYKAPESYDDPLESWVASWWTPELSVGLLIVGGLLLFWPYSGSSEGFGRTEEEKIAIRKVLARK